MRRERTFLLHGAKQLNLGAIISGAGFLLYLLASALEQKGAADLLAVVFGVVSVYVFASVAQARRRDKEGVSYSLLWGQGALALLMGMCAILTVREWLGL